MNRISVYLTIKGVILAAACTASVLLAADTPNASPPAHMVLIPAGTFEMGYSTAEYEMTKPLRGLKENGVPAQPKIDLRFDLPDAKPAHRVMVSAFLCEKFEVSGELWREVYAWSLTNGYSYTSAAGDISKVSAPGHPVRNIFWLDVVKWCNARSEREGLTPCYYTDSTHTVVYRTANRGASAAESEMGNARVNWKANGYRLPTEAEWEKAARGGLTGKRYPWGSEISSSNTVYQCPDCGTKPCGSYPANDYGLHDMAGNVSEWTWDEYDETWYANPAAILDDPRGPESLTGGVKPRVVRGGSYADRSYDLRCARRSKQFPKSTSETTGFRCVRLP